MMMRLGAHALLIGALSAAGNAYAGSTASLELRVDEVFKELDRTDSPGCSMAVFHDGRIDYARGYGMANLELGVRNSPSTVFDIGSTSKQFTAFCIHLLARDGVLSLDDDIRRFLPEIPNYGKTVTVRHLLHHTSGIRDYLGLMTLEGIRDEDLTDDAQALEIIARQRALNFDPGAEHLYSNSGYFLLSMIVKRASGKSLRDFAQERIFGPLGMRHTQFNDLHTRIVPNRATGYDTSEGGGFGTEMSDFEQTGDGAVLTSVEDLLLWDQIFYQTKAGDADLIAQIQIPGKLNDGKTLDYASGLALGEIRGRRTVSHGGAWAGYRAELIRFPDQHLSVACLCNFGSAAPWTLARKVAEIYLGDPMKKDEAPSTQPQPAAPVADLENLAGTYRNPVTGTVWRLAVAEGKLVADMHGMQLELVPIGQGSFRAEGGPLPISVKVESQPSGAPPRLRVEPEGRPVATFDPIVEWTPAPAQLIAYAGEYASDEVATRFRFVVEDGKLVLRHRTLSDEPLRPFLTDGFTAGDATITFTRDSKKRVDGFRLDMGRVKNIRFKRARS